MLINAVCRALGKSEELLPRSHQLMLFWAGLRGAVAFALSSALVGDSAPAMRTTILAVVTLTVLIFGGTTNRMLQLLDIRTGVVEPDDSGSEDEERDLDPVGYRRLRRRPASMYSDMSDDDEEEEHARPLPPNRGNSTMEMSIGGLLSGPLGDPIPESEQPHWFMSFDNKYLKPLFTKRHIQARNQTLAEYWKEKRRKMDRANRSMLAGIRHMSFGQTALPRDDRDGEDADALTLKSVDMDRQQASTSSASPQKKKLVIGSGRVFGRSPSASPPSDEQPQ